MSQLTSTSTSTVMSLNQHCSKCGNKIPDWADLTRCPICLRIEKEAKRFGKQRSLVGYNPQRSGRNRRSVLQAPQSKTQRRTIKTKSVSLAKPPEKPTSLVLLDRFNVLLFDAFKQPVRMSQVLTRAGMSSGQVLGIKQNHQVMIQFLSLAEQLLSQRVAQHLPHIHQDFIRMYYGLDPSGPRLVSVIASHVQCNQAEVSPMYDKIRDFLRSSVGHALIREVVLESARTLLKL